MRPAFRLLGLHVGRRPKTVVLAAVISTILCGCGCLGLRIEYGWKYWLNTETDSYKQLEDIIEPNWPQKDAYSTVLFVAAPGNKTDAGILSADCLLEVQSVQQAIKGMMPTYCGLLDAHCERSLLVELEHQGVTLENARSMLSGKQSANNGILPYSLDSLLGKPCCANAVEQAEALFLRYTLIDGRTDSDDFGERVIELLESWSPSEQARTTCPSLKVFYNTNVSLKKAMQEAMQSDQNLVSVAIMLMIIYLSAVLGRSKNCVNSKVLLGFSVILAVIASLTVSLGLGVIFDLPFTQMTFLAIFVLLGVGVDDALIINDAFARVDASLALDERLAITLEEVGPSVLLTSATDFAAFLVGLSYTVPSLRWFCIHAAIAVFVVFVMQVTFFSACLILDAQRSSAGRCDLCPCFAAPGCVAPKGDIHTGKMQEEQPTKRRQVDDCAVAMLKWMLRPLPGSFIVSIFFGILALSSFFLATHAEKGGSVKDYVPDEHHVVDFWEAEEKYMGSGQLGRSPVTIFSNPIDVASMEELQFTKLAIDAVATSPFSVQPRPETWVDAFILWRAAAGSNVAAGALLPTFLASAGGSKYASDVMAKGGDRAVARAPIWFILPDDSETMAVMTRGMRDLYEQGSSGKLEGFVWSTIFMSVDRWEEIDGDILKSFALAMVAIALVCFVLLPPVAAISSLISIVLVNVDLMGFLSVWGVPLNLAQAAMLVLALGFSVDYSAHIAEGFNVRLQHPGATKQKPAEIMLETLRTTGLSVCNAGMSTVLATAMLSVASTVSFRRMFKNFFLMTLFGLLHGLVLLPILLVFTTSFARRYASFEPVTGRRWSMTAVGRKSVSTQPVDATTVEDLTIPADNSKASEHVAKPGTAQAIEPN